MIIIFYKVYDLKIFAKILLKFCFGSIPKNPIKLFYAKKLRMLLIIKTVFISVHQCIFDFPTFYLQEAYFARIFSSFYKS